MLSSFHRAFHSKFKYESINNRLDNLKIRRNIQKNSSGCKARLTLNTNTDLISMCKNEHNHEIDVIETAVRQVCSDIKSKSTASESTKRIIAQIFRVYPNEVLHKLPSTDATAQQIRYKRQKNLNTHPNHRILVSSYAYPQVGCNTEAAFFFTILQTKTGYWLFQPNPALKIVVIEY